jgi:hypothetical protein
MQSARFVVLALARRAALVALTVAIATLWLRSADAQAPSGAGPATTIEEITVVGRYPGPPLWRVSSGERTLWIFGDLTPVPKGLTWDPRNAERIVERADAVIGPMRIRAPTYNPIKIFRALLAVLRLHGAALDDAGLTLDTGVMKTLERLMRRSDAETTKTSIETEATTVLEELEKISHEAELNCVASVLTTLETDLSGMKERAQAWAVGDVDALQRFDYPDAQGDCLDMLFSSSGLKDLGDELFAKWLAEAEHALATYDTTFAVLPMRELVAADGLLARLGAKGYTVRAP